MNDKNEILTRIDELCQERGWTHYALAKSANIPYSSINNMFRRNTYPSLPILIKLCDGFHIHISDFFKDQGREELTLSQPEIKLVSEFRCLGFHDRELVIAYLQGLCKM